MLNGIATRWGSKSIKKKRDSEGVVVLLDVLPIQDGVTDEPRLWGGGVLKRGSC